MTLSELIVVLGALINSQSAPGASAGLLVDGFSDHVQVQTCPRPLDPREIEGETVVCGVVMVPENHDDPANGNSVALEFVLLKAKTTYPNPDPVLYLHGGPGGGNLPGGAQWVSDNFGSFRATRDIVAFDQRAAGISSDSVECMTLITGTIDTMLNGQVSVTAHEDEGSLTASDFMKNCVAELEAEGIDLSMYNTRQNAFDTLAVMRALGYDTWNLYAASYGTKLSLEVLRSASEGVRSAVLDSVAPPWLRLYENLAQRRSERIERIVAECAAQDACNTAYPDLGTVINEVYQAAKAGEIVWQGNPLPLKTVLTLPIWRNVPLNTNTVTHYLPALFYELHRGGEMPTFDLVYGDWNLFPPHDPEAELRATAAEVLSDSGKALFEQALTSARISEDALSILDGAVTALREQLHRDRDIGPLAALLDAELTAALPSALATGDDARKILRDYATLVTRAASRAKLSEFVTAHFSEARQSRLTALIDAMSDTEIETFFEDANTQVELAVVGFFQEDFDRPLYYCQEDVPFNTLEGYYRTTSALAYSWDEDANPLAETMFAVCDAFETHPRENWHEVVVSDVPVIALGGGGDTATSASWAKAAIEGLSNGRYVYIAEASHIVIRWQPCVRDLAQAFYDHPMRELDDSCVRTAATPPFYIAPWAKTDEQ